MDCTRKCGHFAFGDEAQFIRYLGYYVSIFTIPNYLRLDRRGLYYGIPGRKAGIFNGGEAGEAKASFFFATEPIQYNRHDVRQQQGILRDQFQGVGWEVPRLLENMEAAPDFYFDSVRADLSHTWLVQYQIGRQE